jgi:hypothetical protein
MRGFAILECVSESVSVNPMQKSDGGKSTVSKTPKNHFKLHVKLRENDKHNMKQKK